MKIKFFLGLSATLIYSALFAQSTRDARYWPFAQNSIWNMPIGSNAVYVNAGFQPEAHAQQEIEYIILATPSDPLTQIRYNTNPDAGRCTPQSGVLGNIKFPTNAIIPNDGGNACGSIVNRLIEQEHQWIARCTPGSVITTSSDPAFVENNIETGSGIEGSHGGSGLNAMGGTIRLGELSPGSGPIRHALQFKAWAKKYFYRGSNLNNCYRWPALNSDSYALDPVNQGGYGGTNSAVRPGSLVAIPPGVSISTLGLTTVYGQKIAQALQDYGAYIVDDTYWDDYDFSTEYNGFDGVYEQYQRDYGILIDGAAALADINKIVVQLKVVNNNSATSIGGGGTPRVALAPPFGSAVAVTGVSLSPTSASVAVNGTTQLTATVAPANASNQSVTWSTSNSTIATVSATGLVTGKAAGTATITVTTVDGGKTATSSITVTPAVGGSLTGSVALNTNAVNLTSVGTSDWKHFYNNVHKSSGTNSISNYTVIGGTASGYTDDVRNISWTDGTPTASSTNNKTGRYIAGINKGFSFTAPAGNGNNTLYVYVGGYNAAGKLTASLSNGAATNYVNTTANISGSFDALYTINYNAGATGQTITISWIQTAGTGNVTIQAAGKTGSASRPASAKLPAYISNNFSLYPNPASQYAVMEVNSNVTENSMIKIIDESGNVKYKTYKFLRPGNNIIKLSLVNLNLPAGFYYVQLHSNNLNFIKKLIISGSGL